MVADKKVSSDFVLTLKELSADEEIRMQNLENRTRNLRSRT